MAELMTVDEFAQLARVPISTVRYWRTTGVGPVGFKLGKRVVYLRADIEAWLNARHAAAVIDAHARS